MNEQIIKLLENVNLALEPLLQSIAKLTGVSVDFVEQNFETMFYQAGRYMFWDEMLDGFGMFLIFFPIMFGLIVMLLGLILLLITDFSDELLNKYKGISIDKSIKLFIVFIPVAYVISKIKDIILYNVAKEIWIVEHLSHYINMIK